MPAYRDRRTHRHTVTTPDERAIAERGSRTRGSRLPSSAVAGACLQAHHAGMTRSANWKASRKPRVVGVYKGRPASIDPAQVRRLKAQGLGPSQIAKQLGVARAS